MDDDETLASCFHFRQRIRSFDSKTTSLSTVTRHAPLSLLTRMLCSGFDASARYSADKLTQIPLTSSTYRCGTARNVSPPPLCVSLQQQGLISVVTDSVDSPSYGCCQVPADSSTDFDVTADVKGTGRGLMTSRCGHTRRKQQSQQQKQSVLMAGWMYDVQPAASSSSPSWSSSGLHRKRTSFYHSVQVIEIDQTQRVRVAGAAASQHTEQLHD